MLPHPPDSARLADEAAAWKSAYVHVPFCRRRCPYCDFAIVDESAGGAVGTDQYTSALISEIAMEDPFGPLDAVNFGGGTPSRLSPVQLKAIIDALRRQFSLSDQAEISLEVNPEDWSEAFGSGIADAGFTRVSIGAQSFDPQVLDGLGRLHTAEMITKTVEGVRASGVASVGLDLIFGHPTESDDSWRSTVASAVEIGVDHISTYALTVEPGTVLSRAVSDGAQAPDDDTQAERYHWFAQESKRSGFVRYELSNYAQPGHVCRYNLSTWAHGEYVAFGMGAHDHRWGRRTRNHRRIDRYMEAVESGVVPVLGSEEIDAYGQARDRLMVGLRLAAGTPRTPIGERFIASDSGRRLIEAGILVVHDTRLRVADPMLADSVIREALSVSPPDC